jgi:hypothetical protein
MYTFFQIRERRINQLKKEQEEEVLRECPFRPNLKHSGAKKRVSTNNENNEKFAMNKKGGIKHSAANLSFVY